MQLLRAFSVEVWALSRIGDQRMYSGQTVVFKSRCTSQFFGGPKLPRAELKFSGSVPRVRLRETHVVVSGRMSLKQEYHD